MVKKKPERIVFEVDKKTKEEIKNYAQTRGMTISGFILVSLREKMQPLAKKIPDHK